MRTIDILIWQRRYYFLYSYTTIYPESFMVFEMIGILFFTKPRRMITIDCYNKFSGKSSELTEI